MGLGICPIRLINNKGRVAAMIAIGGYLRGPDGPPYHPVSVYRLQIHGGTYLFPHLMVLRLFLVDFFSSQRTQSGWSSWTLAVFKILFIVGVVCVVDYCCASFGGAAAGRDILSLENGLEKGVCILADSRRIASHKCLCGCHDDRADGVMNMLGSDAPGKGEAGCQVSKENLWSATKL